MNPISIKFVASAFTISLLHHQKNWLLTKNHELSKCHAIASAYFSTNIETSTYHKTVPIKFKSGY